MYEEHKQQQQQKKRDKISFYIILATICKPFFFKF